MADSEFGMLTKMGSSRNPVQESRYQQLLANGETALTTDGSAAQDIYAQQQKMIQQANAPIVQNLQSQIPTIQQQYAVKGSALTSQQPLLEQQYQQLLSDVRGQGSVALNQANIGAAQELGRRGISTQTGFADQYTQKQTNPINQWLTQSVGSIGLGSATAQQQLQNLINQNPIDALNAVQQVQSAIAQLQAGGNQQAIQSAYQQQQLAEQQKEFAAQEAYRNAQAQYYNMRATSLPDLYGAQAAQILAKLGNNTSGNVTGNVGVTSPYVNPLTTQQQLQQFIY